MPPGGAPQPLQRLILLHDEVVPAKPDDVVAEGAEAPIALRIGPPIERAVVERGVDLHHQHEVGPREVDEPDEALV
ncbi:MAG TPA: hypothetical protein VFK43_17750, partial [Acidimicrobiales bacterium]|nr:hypothetical protein [Acidimicrobiales bacterium]